MKSETVSTPSAVLSALFVLAGGTASAATELDLRADLGYDSNVFNLNGSIGERHGMFSHLEAGFRAEDTSPSGWIIGMDLGVAAQLFESSVTDGDGSKYFMRVRATSRGKRREHAFDWALRYGVRNSTYVSRFTGVVAADEAGNEIADRFDNAIGDLRGAWHFPGGGYGRVSLEGSVRTKDYRSDYKTLGLDRLDYNQFGITPEYAVGGGDSTFRVGLALALRQYRDRRVSDVNGNPVAGTDLQYRYYGIDARYEHEFTRANTLEFSGGYEIREDNGVGFYDRTRWNTGVEWTYRPAARTRLSIAFDWSSRVFDRPVIGDPTISDEIPEKNGYRLNVRYVRPFPVVKTVGFSLLAEAGWESFDNSDDVRFSYDRLEAFAGIRKEF